MADQYRKTQLLKGGNMTQNRRKRAMDGFRAGKYDILVATDIAARGIDVSDISHVINYDMPDTVDAYTHRIGRTGRAEQSGEAFTFVGRDDEARRHGELHAFFKPDDNARDRAVAVARRNHPAANVAAEAVVVYDLHRPGSEVYDLTVDAGADR